MELCEEKLKEYLTVLGYREEVQDSLIKFAREINKLINQITEFLDANSINNQIRTKANKEIKQEWRKAFKSFKRASNELDSQGHSGMSYSLMKAMIFQFCTNGKEFVKYLEGK
ncbi:hypothetical protein ACSSOE_06980 [Intestinibacter bartlettii]|uniref:hypothetical protein n=1 Tax=Intestinibacter bartlettii TaxID=261299 RepID=UPI00403D5616